MFRFKPPKHRRPARYVLALTSCLLLSLTQLTACSTPKPQVEEIPVPQVVKLADPQECLTCQSWPVESAPLSQSKKPVDDLVSLMAKAKAAYEDCSAKLACVAKFQSSQLTPTK